MKKISFLLFLAIFTPNLHSNGALARALTAVARRAPVIAKHAPRVSRAAGSARKFISKISDPRVPYKSLALTGYLLGGINGDEIDPNKTYLENYKIQFEELQCLGRGLKELAEKKFPNQERKDRLHQILSDKLKMNGVAEIEDYCKKHPNLTPSMASELKKTFKTVVGRDDINVEIYTPTTSEYESTMGFSGPACIIGLFSKQMVVILHQDCLEEFNLQILKSIIGHEALHAKESHIDKENYADIIYLGIWKSLDTIGANLVKNRTVGLRTLKTIVTRTPIAALCYVSFPLYKAALSRYCEKRADKESSKVLGSKGARNLADFLSKDNETQSPSTDFPKEMFLPKKNRLLSTHPDHETRVKYLTKLADKLEEQAK